MSLTSSTRKRIRADGSVVREKRFRYSCNYNVRHPGQCDGQSGYGVTKLDGIVESVFRMKFAEIRECSRKKLLEEMHSKERERIKQEVRRLEKELEIKRQEQEVLKDETIRVIRGTSTQDREMLSELLAENKAAVAQAHEALQAAKAEQQSLEQASEKMRRDCDDLFTWANVYDAEEHSPRQNCLLRKINLENGQKETPQRLKRCGLMVDLIGIEPTTLRMRTVRSPS